jgi:pyochelin synthetase
MDHRTFSGIEVMRELTRRKGADAALFPVVFTSAIGLAETTGGDVPMGEFGYGISQTPQVVIDCQNMERAGGLATNWDIREGVLPDGVVDDMFAAFVALLHRLASDEQTWESPPPPQLPAAQRERRDQVNATAMPVVRRRLHDAFFETARERPGEAAIIGADSVLSYGDLARAARGVAERLAGLGCGHGDLVAITLERGPAQVVAVLGALLAGAVYVPIDVVQPIGRRNEIIDTAGVRFVLTGSQWAGGWPVGVVVIDVEQVSPAEPRQTVTGAAPGDLAYVIHTSGSTGTPKGVMITHEAALNTVLDISSRFGITGDDRVLGLSQLGFDLSVYDIFGPLSVGGALVIPDPSRRADPSHWADLIARYGITVWNSVPAQLQMLSGYLTIADSPRLPSLRLAMLSGDWIPVALPDQIRGQVPGLQVISLGGATEASIWSICYPIGTVGAEWASIPYGTPLANQTFHVYDPGLRDCPDWVTGELYIGGIGVGAGYLHDEARTAERFVVHPVSGRRLYRTGDLGRYQPDGNIEFLGREDHQVKIRGYRIELAEIEAALASHPAVAGCAMLVDGDLPLERRLVGFAEPATVPAPPIDAALLAQLDRAARQAGDAELAGVDTARYLTYARALDRVALPAMLDTLRQAGLFAGPDDRHTLADIFASTDADPRHHRLLRRWLRALTTEGVLACAEGRYRLPAASASPARGSASPDRGSASPDSGWAAVTEAALPSEEGLLDYFKVSIAHLPALLRGTEDPLKLLFPDGRLDVAQQLYEDALFNRWANRAAAAVTAVLGARGQYGRPLRVLEVGAGGGGTTAAVLDALAGREFDYLCTDLSPYFTGQAQARFAGVDGLRFAVYDLDADYARQGLAPNSYDLIIAGDVLHATADIDRVLGQLRELAAPGGWLVALEMTRDHYQIMTSLELLVRLDDSTGDFADERQGTDLVFLGRDRWERALQRAGAPTSICLPPADTFVGELGMCVLAAQFKTDRAPVHPHELDAYLRTRLPDYMVPAALQILDELPVTDNGKVDRRMLARRLPGRQGGHDTGQTGSAPATDLEARLAAMWTEALGVPVGRDGNLFELGGDSLVAAQLTGRMIEELPEARPLFFDELLRNLLEQATVGRLANWLVEAAQHPTEAGSAPAGTVPAELLTPLHALGTGVPRIFLPDATGALSGVDTLAGALLPAAAAYGLSGAGLAPLPSIELVAAGYAQAVIDADLAQVEIYGQGLMAVLAVEVARILTERGVLVEGVTLYDGQRPDPATGPNDIAAAYAALAGDDTVPAAFAQLFDAVSRFEPAIYAGDLTVVQPSDADHKALGLWEDICLGDLRVVEAGRPAAHLLWSQEPVAAALAANRR